MGQALDVFRRRAQKVQAVAVDVVRVAEDVADVARVPLEEYRNNNNNNNEAA